MPRLAFAVLLLLPAMGQAQSRDEVEFVTALFEEIQPLSFAKRREYCGFIGITSDGALSATPPVEGNRDSCPLEWPSGLDVRASYHTHGAFDFSYHNELPSDVDLLADRRLGVDGWIATPGGRGSGTSIPRGWWPGRSAARGACRWRRTSTRPRRGRSPSATPWTSCGSA
ncbi:DUF4329 domain-containing protein [Rubellimicrobium aerolatum]|uniref:DUF4329 domain-containing protein n=1 Tax=Rubellimicrobium aerolatum TaxID=490979 RepID=A0ABW0S9L8_9RHOB|nr:DUF4329 domain-containing protein [Rubellimicrobium aerolatum]MBP1804965.1 hypothetical protein [Rubellimicrobium aerolatum]